MNSISDTSENRKSRYATAGKVVGVIVLTLLLGGGAAAYAYWLNLKSTPQYSLALILDAARRDDQAAIDELVDIDAVVDDFMPQVTDKAVELYGRGLPPQTLMRAAVMAKPLMPAVKDRARAELPSVIRNKTERLEHVPFAAIVLGSEQYLGIDVRGDSAEVTSLMPDRPLEVRMRRNGERWQIVGVEDERLATAIAERIGQELLAAAHGGSIERSGQRLGVQNLQEILKQAEDLIK